MGTRDLPDIYAQAGGPQALGIYISIYFSYKPAVRVTIYIPDHRDMSRYIPDHKLFDAKAAAALYIACTNSVLIMDFNY